MTYIDYLNRFNRWIEEDNPTDKAIILYYAMLDMFSRRGWPRWAGVDTQRLMLMVRANNKQAAFRARDALVEAGFLEYKPGKKGKATEYHLLEKGYKSDTENVTKNVTESVLGTKFDTENVTGNVTEKTFGIKNVTENVTKNVTESVTENGTPNKTKKKTQTKTGTDREGDSPPIPPKSGGQDADVTPDALDLSVSFDTFWRAYPRKKGKQDAWTAWKKLRPDKGLVEQILQAVADQKGWKQWQKDNGQYIPYPATWLNGRRWEDEEPDGAKLSSEPKAWGADAYRDDEGGFSFTV